MNNFINNTSRELNYWKLVMNEFDARIFKKFYLSQGKTIKKLLSIGTDLLKFKLNINSFTYHDFIFKSNSTKIV